MMKRLSLAIAAVLWVATAHACLLTTHVGACGNSGPHPFTPPTPTPAVATLFNASSANGLTNNALKPNQGGAAGAMELPANPKNSFVLYAEGNINPALGAGTPTVEYAWAQTSGVGLILTGNAPGLPHFLVQRNQGGAAPGAQWWLGVSMSTATTQGASASVGTGYTNGLYTGTATGGCLREPSVVWNGGVARLFMTDPGFMCTQVAPTITPLALAGDGQQQTVGVAGGGAASTCLANSPVSGSVTVTANVAVAHGINPGQTYVLGGFPTVFSTTYTALPGTSGGTLVGTAAINGGSCTTPVAFAEGTTALGGTGSTMNFTNVLPAVSNPFGSGTGITTKTAGHFCAAFGEYGLDSNNPGFAFAAFTDREGTALAGSPALVTWPNLGSANFTGYILNAAQSPSSPALNVTAMNAYAITAATYTAASGSTPAEVTFTTSTASGFSPGSEFTVSGVTPTGYNQTYIAVAGTSGTTVKGNPLTGPGLGTQALANPGAYSSAGSMVSVIFPGMQVFGTNGGLTGGTQIALYGAYGSTGTGGVGTYGLLQATPTGAGTITVSSVTAPSAGLSTITITNSPQSLITIGTQITLAAYGANPMIVTQFGTGNGAAGNYIVSNTNTGSFTGPSNATSSGLIGSIGTPVPIFAFPAFYQTAAGVPGSTSFTLNARTRAATGDFFPIIGSDSVAAGKQSGWGGSLANISNIYGVFPQTTGGVPDTSQLASICKKQQDIPTFVAAQTVAGNTMSLQSLHRLDDPGMWAESSIAEFNGTISGTGLTINSTLTGSTTAMAAGTVIAGSGITGCPTRCPTIASGSGTSYVLSAGGGTVTAGAMKAGAWKPAAPLATQNFLGYIDNAGSLPTLHVTSIPTGWTGTGSLGNIIQAASITGTTLTVTTATELNTGYALLGVGTVLTCPLCSAGTTITATALPTNSNTGTGAGGTYTITPSQTVASVAMWASVTLPGPATALQVSATASGALAANMLVTDGGVSINGQPIFVSGASTTVNALPAFPITPTYYPPSSILNDATMAATTTTLVPGQYITNIGITTPVSIAGFQTLSPCAATGFQGCGTYTLSNASSNGVGSIGSPATFIGTGLGDAGAAAPGPALTITDQGPGVVFPVTPSTVVCASYGNCTGTGPINISGKYDTSVLLGTPSTIQAQISYSSNGPPIAGCSACAWTNLSGYSATLSSGTVWNWTGRALNIPASDGPLFVSVRAANGAAYANLSNFVKMGLPIDVTVEGNAVILTSIIGGNAASSYQGMWGWTNWSGGLDTGPALTGNYFPATSQTTLGDRYNQGGGTFPEGVNNYSQRLSNAFGGWPVTMVNSTRDGIGINPSIMGNVQQIQTIGAGDTSTKVWCSAAKFCGATSTPVGIVSVAGPLYFTGATQTGGQIENASISGTTLTIPIGNQTTSAPNTSGMVWGALEPGFVLGVTGSPTLAYCTAGCGAGAYQNLVSSGGGFSAAQTWQLNCTGACPTLTGGAIVVVSPPGGAIWPNYNVQGISGTGAGGISYINTGFGTQFIKNGTFQVTVNGTVVCQDTTAFIYNNQAGNCTGTGVSGWVNYTTGDYGITFTSAPASGAVILGVWTNIITPDGNTTPATSRPVGIDYFGDGTSTSGPTSSIFAKTPSGVSLHVFGTGISDQGFTAIGGDFAMGSAGYNQAVSWLYGTKFPNVLPGQTASTPFACGNYWRGQGPNYFIANSISTKTTPMFSQFTIDECTKSTWTGSITSSVLTLSATPASGTMWEGEPIAVSGVPTGDYIVDLKTGTWGGANSTYDVANASIAVANVSSSAMANSSYYLGAGPAFYAGPQHDIITQQGGLGATTGYGAHGWLGMNGGRRVGARWAAQHWGGLTNTANASNPTLDRVKANASGCDTGALAAPCFDIGNTFAASHSATITGSQVVVTGGIAAHDRPFVVGQLLTCSGCTAGRFITTLSVPPTQDTRAGQGEVGQTFTITANASLLTGPTTETVTGGCSGVSGTGSNCIDIAVQQNTTNGTYGTAWALATCGENNLNGAAPNYSPPGGVCASNGIGSMVNASFRIGAQQHTWAFATGGPTYYDGLDPEGGEVVRNSPFTCNIVAAKVVQCVKGAAYTVSPFSVAIGQWPSATTFVSYGDPAEGVNRIATLMGSAGGQSMTFTPGSGYTNNPSSAPYALPVVCTSISGTREPKIDVIVSGGAIVDAYPSASTAGMGLGLGGGCTVLLTPLGAGTGGSISIPLAPFTGQPGIGTLGTDMNEIGNLLYDNSGFPGNPLNPFFSNGSGGYFEPGLPVQPFGNYLGSQVSG
jgi:hypothetical protein